MMFQESEGQDCRRIEAECLHCGVWRMTDSANDVSPPQIQGYWPDLGKEVDAWAGPLSCEDQSFVLVCPGDLRLSKKWSVDLDVRMQCRRRVGIFERTGK